MVEFQSGSSAIVSLESVTVITSYGVTSLCVKFPSPLASSMDTVLLLVSTLLLLLLVVVVSASSIVVTSPALVTGPPESTSQAHREKCQY
jgi:hypothetical protein